LSLKQDLEEIINQGFEFLKQAEDAENAQDFPTAIYKYQKAAELLGKCEVARDKLTIIYDRITELHKLNEYYKTQSMQSTKVDPYKLQEQAFSLIDQAKLFEKSRDYQKSIDCLLQAVDLLYDSGWTIDQLMSFKDWIDKLKNCIQQNLMKNITNVPNLPSNMEVESNHSQNISDFSSIQSESQLKSSIRSKSIDHSINELQNKAFDLIDKSKQLEKIGSYKEAIENLLEAVPLLLQSGWNEEQVLGIKNEIEKIQNKMNKVSLNSLKQSNKLTEPISTFAQVPQKDVLPHIQKVETSEINKQEYIPTFAQVPQKDVLPHIQKVETSEINKQEYIPTFAQVPQKDVLPYIQKVETSEIKRQEYIPMFSVLQQGISVDEIEKQNLQTKMEIQQRRKMIEERQNEAFRLLDEANKLEKNNDYENSINIYKKVVDIFSEIGWTNEANKVLETIDKLQSKSIKSELKSQNIILSKISKQKELLERITENIEGKSKIDEQVITSSSLKLFEEKRKFSKEKEEEAFKYLDNGKKYLEQKRYDEAIADFNRAITILEQIGWNDYVPKIKQTIQDIISQKSIEESKLTKTPAAEKATEELKIDDRKQVWIQNQALNYIVEAQNYASRLDFNKALNRYNQAIELLIRIGWNDQINQVRELIKELQKQKQISEFNMQKQLINKIQQDSQERKIMQQIADKKRMEEIERENAIKQQKLKEFEEKKKKENEFYNKALSLIEEAGKIKRSTINDYDLIIEKYQQAKDFLSNISWALESRIVQEMIQNLKEEKERKIQEESQRLKILEEFKKQQKEVEETMKKQIESYSMKIEDKSIKLKEFEKQQAQRKELELRAFKLIEEAEQLSKQQAYIDSVELYQQAIEIFKKIGWNDQIKYLEDKIRNIYDSQKRFMEKYHIMKQKQLEESLEKSKIFEQKKHEELSKILDIKEMIRAIENKKKATSSSKKEEIPSTFGFSLKEKRVSIKDELFSTIETKRKEIQDQKLKEK